MREKNHRLYIHFNFGMISLIILFASTLFISWKYLKLKEAYKGAEKDKIYYCSEYYKLKCKTENSK